MMHSRHFDCPRCTFPCLAYVSAEDPTPLHICLACAAIIRVRAAHPIVWLTAEDVIELMRKDNDRVSNLVAALLEVLGRRPSVVRWTQRLT